jgi:formaldehyde-activating enzyme involved in methanogenesis
MNKYQKVISKITKCDLKKQVLYGFTYREVRNSIKRAFKDYPFKKLLDYKNFNSKYPI